MRRSIFILGLALNCLAICAQQVSIDDVLDLSSFSSRKFDNYVARKGFVPSGRFYQQDTMVNTWQQAFKAGDSDRTVSRRLSKYQLGKSLSYSFQTSSREEFLDAVAKLRKEGFNCGSDNISADTSFVLQRRNQRVQGQSFIDDSTTFYSLVFEEKQMPKAVRFGDDLLQFTSHELLASYFGKKNVRKDLYYFSEHEFSRCSILFPNTPRQAVFVWNDQENLERLSHIIIGASIRTSTNADFTRPVQENTWAMESGIRYNMKLDNLAELAGADVSFYGRNSEYYLMLLPKNKGGADLGNTGIVLDCLNCEGDTLLDKKVITASEANAHGLRLHVSLIVLMPGTSN